MRLVKKFIDKDGIGTITLRPEEADDLWHVYQLVVVGDHITSKTFRYALRCTTVSPTHISLPHKPATIVVLIESTRRVQKETINGNVESERVKITVSIEVEKVDFNPGSHEMRISGPCISENVFLKMGAYHTLDLQINANFVLFKPHWDSIALERVEEATNPEKNADAAAVIMNEGLAHICLITGSMTIPRAKIENTIPRKHKSAVTGHDKALQKFFDNVMQGIQRHVNFDIVKAVIIASPGFIKDQFMEYMLAQAQQKNIQGILDNKGKFLTAHSSSGHRHALREVLEDEAVINKLADTKAAGEVRALNEFYDMLKKEPDRAYYGVSHVTTACERQAVATLLLVDDLFRAADIATRNKYVNLVESVKDNGGQAHIFSSMHQSGEQLAQLGGIAAILRFPMPDLDVE